MRIKLYLLIILSIFELKAYCATKLCNEVEVKFKIRKMIVQDQNIRNEILNSQTKGQAYLNELFEQLKKIDSDNNAELKNILTRCGWPKKKMLGAKIHEDFWTLMQHADADIVLQKKALKEFELLAKHDSTELKHYAYLKDRILMHQKLPQYYGTQGHCLKSNCWKPFPIFDEKNIDRRRRSVYLPPFSDYRTKMNSFCK